MPSTQPSDNDVVYLTASEAGKHFGYTKDYILLLLKQEKLKGKRDGRRWLVNLPAAEEYFSYARRRREVQRAQLREERRKELRSKLAQPALPSPSRLLLASPYAKMALLETFAIVLIGICVGSVGYTGISSQALVRGSFSSHVNTLALSVYDFFSGDTRSADGVLSPDASLFENKEEVVHDPEVKNIFIIAPQASMSEGAAAEIERMFSDPVEVSIDENDPQWGTVIPQFEGMQGEPHRFFVVPVHSEESS